jgi:hypothetical protein
MLVDSKKKMLEPPEIILEAVRQIKSNKYTPDQVFASVMMEAQQDGAVLMRQGNTLFIVHGGKDRTALFRALNADTAKNYLENSVVFAKAMYMAGYDVMVTDFQDSTLLSIFKYVQQNRDKVNPDVDGKPTMGYAVQKLKTIKEGGEGYRVTTVLGPKREGQMK